MSIMQEITDADKVLGFLAAILTKLNLLIEGQIEDSFIIDFYGDEPGITGIIGTQNRGMFRVYNGPFMITDIVATWTVGNAPSSLSTTGAANATTTQTIPAPPAGISTTVNDLNVVFSAASLNATTLTVVSGADTLYSTVLPTGTTSFQVPVALTGLPGTSIVTTVTAGGAAITSTVNSTSTQSQSVILQIDDRLFQLPPLSGNWTPNDLKLEVQRDSLITLTVTPPAACHLEIMGHVKKRARESTHS